MGVGEAPASSVSVQVVEGSVTTIIPVLVEVIVKVNDGEIFGAGGSVTVIADGEGTDHTVISETLAAEGVGPEVSGRTEVAISVVEVSTIGGPPDTPGIV